jgi:hypothetical protein
MVWMSADGDGSKLFALPTVKHGRESGLEFGRDLGSWLLAQCTVQKKVETCNLQETLKSPNRTGIELVVAVRD